MRFLVKNTSKKKNFKLFFACYFFFEEYFDAAIKKIGPKFVFDSSQSIILVHKSCSIGVDTYLKRKKKKIRINIMSMKENLKND
jgi:hypothetical protein